MCLTHLFFKGSDNEAATQAKSKKDKKKTKKGKKTKQKDDDDLDAILADLEKPTEKPSKGSSATFVSSAVCFVKIILYNQSH